MTAIAAVVEDGKVWMGGDSAGVAGYSMSIRKDPKVFKNGQFLIGYTSSFRMGQILRFGFTAPPPFENEDPYRYMVVQFVPAAREAIKAGGWLATNNGREEGGTFLVGWRGRLFSIESDFQVGELHDCYCACGCGQDVVLGSLYTTAEFDIPPAERIRGALKAAERFSAGVRSPFVVISE